MPYYCEVIPRLEEAIHEKTGCNVAVTIVEKSKKPVWKEFRDRAENVGLPFPYAKAACAIVSIDQGHQRTLEATHIHRPDLCFLKIRHNRGSLVCRSIAR